MLIEAGEQDRSLTPSQLARLSLRFAALLRANGLGPGSRIAMVAENRLEWPAAFFGIQLSGAVECLMTEPL